jgi:hypothetical protein
LSENFNLAYENFVEEIGSFCLCSTTLSYFFRALQKGLFIAGYGYGAETLDSPTCSADNLTLRCESRGKETKRNRDGGWG